MISKIKKLLFIGILPAFFLVSLPACKTGEGCLATEKMNEEVDLSNSKRGKSNLFGKKRRKRIRKKTGS